MNQISVSIVLAGVIVAVAVLYSTGSFDAKDEAPPYEVAVRNKFTDPESVRFRNVIRHSGFEKYCGEVNAKNRLGGYVGWQRFVALDMTSLGKPWVVTIAKEVNNNFPIWCS